MPPALCAMRFSRRLSFVVGPRPETLDALADSLGNGFLNVLSFSKTEDHLRDKTLCYAEFPGDFGLAFPGSQKEDSYFDRLHDNS